MNRADSNCRRAAGWALSSVRSEGEKKKERKSRRQNTSRPCRKTSYAISRWVAQPRRSDGRARHRSLAISIIAGYSRGLPRCKIVRIFSLGLWGKEAGRRDNCTWANEPTVPSILDESRWGDESQKLAKSQKETRNGETEVHTLDDRVREKSGADNESSAKKFRSAAIVEISRSGQITQRLSGRRSALLQTAH